MNEIPESELFILNQKGLIPGPLESAEAFSQRTAYSLGLKNNLSKEMSATFPGISFSQEKNASEAMEETADHLKKTYDFSADWVPLIFSDYKLPFWQGGCAWIFQMQEDSPLSALVQLRETFRKKPVYLGIYHRTELLVHELCHIGRAAYQEPQFEEILAYRTSSSPFRRWLGPFFQSSSESALFMLLIFILAVFDVFLVALNKPDAYSIALWLKLIPVLLLLAGTVRLWKRHKTLDACIKNLTPCIGIEKAEAVAYRLQDNEIKLFSKMGKTQIERYADSKAEEELRWKMIFQTYFSPKNRF